MSRTRHSYKARVLGHCYVCGFRAWGVLAPWAAPTEIRRGVVRDVNGIRHGGCDPFKRGSRVNPAHA